MSLLSTHALSAFYGDFQALFGIDVVVEPGELIAIIGANGAGKSTFLKTVAGLLAAPREAVWFGGNPIGGLPAPEIMRRGIAMVPEGRRLFASLSVEENLLIGNWGRKTRGRWNLSTIYELFPLLREVRTRPATRLSGGQQQMVAIARALMSNPELLLCDEISLGLAPTIIRDIYAVLPTIRAEGVSLIIVEQDVLRALEVADRVYCFQEGRMTLAGRPVELSREAIHDAYFGH